MKMVSNHAPIALLFILGVGFVFQAAITDDTINQPQFEINSPTNQSEEGGFLESFTPDAINMIAAIIGVIWSFVKTFFNFLTFNVPGAPGWIRFIVAMTINGSLAWSIVALIRGGQ